MGGPLPLAVALLAVMGLVGLVHLLGFGEDPSLAGTREAEEIAQTLPGGFVATETVLAKDGSGALLRDASGRIAVVAAIGSHFLARLLEYDWAVALADNGQLAIAGEDFSCRLSLDGSAPHWFKAMRQAQQAAP